MSGLPIQAKRCYWMDKSTRQISYMYFASDGGVSNGTVEVQDRDAQVSK